MVSVFALLVVWAVAGEESVDDAHCCFILVFFWVDWRGKEESPSSANALRM